jgi:hypothetical protein
MLVMLLLLCGDDNGVWEDYDSGGFGRDDCVVLVEMLLLLCGDCVVLVEMILLKGFVLA